jgi:hypothetical protein
LNIRRKQEKSNTTWNQNHHTASKKDFPGKLIKEYKRWKEGCRVCPVNMSHPRNTIPAKIRKRKRALTDR